MVYTCNPGPKEGQVGGSGRRVRWEGQVGGPSLVIELGAVSKKEGKAKQSENKIKPETSPDISR